MTIQVASYAKINWYLIILGRRADDFHELRTLLQTVDLADELGFETSPRSRIQLKVSGRPLPSGTDNLVIRAAQLLQDQCGVSRGARILLHKRIPIGAGLGGGSSNAAVTLLALNQLWGTNLAIQELVPLAANLGSDVPFFLTGGTAGAEGRGETIIPFPDLHSDLPIGLFYPGFSVSTAEAYQRACFPLWKASTEVPRRETVKSLFEKLKRGDWTCLKNDLQPSVLAAYPRLTKAYRSLQRRKGTQVMLCGSGSCLLLLGDDLTPPTGTGGDLGQVEMFSCRILSGQEYRKRLRRSGVKR